MKIGLIDADLLGRKNHRFPNLALMKISSFYKQQGNQTTLLFDYNNLNDYDKIFLSRAFTDAKIPVDLDKIPNLEYGGTGFYLENAPDLDPTIEHSFPDYSLYDPWVRAQTNSGRKLRFYTDYSIGFTTRGCFRKCGFCVNKKYDRVSLHSPISEFLNETRKKIILLDDNFLGYNKHIDILNDLILTGKRFKFKQGLDIRILTEETAELLSCCKYDEDYIFAFDNIKDSELIKRKLEMWRSYTNKSTMLYTLVAYDSVDIDDIKNMLSRIKILMQYKCAPYIMRYESFKESEFRRLYTNVARWCNQPAIFKRMSYREFCTAQPKHSAYKSMIDFEKNHPDVAKEYFDLKFQR